MKTASDGTKVARFALANLEAGDILLSTDPDSTESTAIRAATRSLYSHAAICDGGLNFYEAADNGVLNFNYMRFGIFSKDNVRVLRLKSNVKNRSSIARSAGLSAERYREREYWTPGAIASVFRVPVSNRRDGFFCSFLVAQCYQEAGFELCEGLRPQEVHPGDIAKSESLDDITDAALYNLPPWDERPCVIDSSNDAADCRDAPSIQMAFARAMMLREMRPLFEKKGLGSPSTFDNALVAFLSDQDKGRQRELDALLSSILDKHHYSELAKRYFSRLLGQDHFDRDKYAGMPLEVLAASIELNKSMGNKWAVRSNGWRSQEAFSSDAFKTSGLNFFRLHRDFCRSSAEIVEKAQASISEHIADLERCYEEIKSSH